MQYNQLRSLPESFGNITVGSHLRLQGNRLKSLPKSFGNIKVEHALDLSNNLLQSLPESFGNIRVGDTLHLNNNRLPRPSRFNKITSLFSRDKLIEIPNKKNLPHVKGAIHN